MNHAALLIKEISMGRDCVTLEKKIRLPIPPAPWFSLGLCEHSDFRSDEEEVKRVMYHACDKVWMVELRSMRLSETDRMSFTDFLQTYYLGDGWRIRLTCGLDSVEEGKSINSDIDEDLSIIEARAGLWLVSERERKIMDLTGEKYKIHYEGSA